MKKRVKYELIYEPYEREEGYLAKTTGNRIVKDHLSKKEVTKEIKLIALEHAGNRGMDFRLLEILLQHKQIDLLMQFGEIGHHFFEEVKYRNFDWLKVKQFDIEDINVTLNFLRNFTIRIMPKEVTIGELLK